jgi:serine/threonine protein kinase
MHPSGTRSIYVKDIRIVRRLGGGNFGEVYEGVWHGSTPVALKQVQSQQIDDFLREASMLMYVCPFTQHINLIDFLFSNLHHPNVVQCYGIYIVPPKSVGDSNNNHHQQGGAQYIVTELLPLGDVKRLLLREGRKISLMDLINM